jgi:hypothetical protein
MTDITSYNQLESLYEERGGDYFEDFLLDGCGEIKGFEFIEQDGGGEGGAEDCYSIVKVDGVFYKVTYAYYSHHGFETDYAGVFKVTPREKTITVYE